MRNYVKIKRLKDMYFAKKALRTMNFKGQLFHPSPFFCKNSILKIGDKITLENILFVNKSIKRQIPAVFYDWFTFSGDLL